MKALQKTNFVINASVLTAFLLFAISCDRPGDEVGYPTGPIPTVDHLVSQGWDNYEAGDYAAAKEDFTDAINKDVFYKEAYLGLGWTLNRLSDYNSAVQRFDLLLTLVESTEEEWQLLSHAGKALSYMGSNADSLACLEIENYLDINDTSFTFAHDSRVSTDNMKILLLNGYWNYNDYYGVQSTILARFNSNWLSDLISSDDNISSETDSTGSVLFEFEVDTSASPFDTTITRAWIEISENSNLIDVTSVTDSLSNSYTVSRFNHGSNVVSLDLDSIDESVLWDDMSQPVVVNFTDAEDYGAYLNTLLETVESQY